jgi:V8-like Glu-specific endopeptidase
VERTEFLSLGVGYKYMREVISNIGYRKDDVAYEKELAIQKMEQSEGDHTVVSRRHLQHRITTTAGSSGGPIIVDRQGTPLVVAIHKGIVTKSKGKRLSFTKRENSARIVSEDMLATLLDWEKEFFLEDFESQINAFQLDASPSLKLIPTASGF